MKVGGKPFVGTAATAVALALVLLACEPSTTIPCDLPDSYSCVDGVVYLGGCTQPRVAAQCVRGCADPGKSSAYNCPFSLCRENQAKTAGDACMTTTDCQPTVATVLGTAVYNTYLACDAATQTCVATDAPVVADWMAPCSPDLIAQLAADGQTYGFASVTPDPGCAEGWCAVSRDVGGTCIANACTRTCTGDQDCPTGSTCVGAAPAGCFVDFQPYCRPGGPAGNGFTCN